MQVAVQLFWVKQASSQTSGHDRWGHPCWNRVQLSLGTITGKTLKLPGEVLVTVSYKDKVKLLPLVVVSGSGLSLLGRVWLADLDLILKNCFWFSAWRGRAFSGRRHMYKCAPGSFQGRVRLLWRTWWQECMWNWTVHLIILDPDLLLLQWDKKLKLNLFIYFI